MNIEIKGVITLLVITVFMCIGACSIIAVKQKDMGQGEQATTHQEIGKTVNVDKTAPALVGFLSVQAGDDKGNKLAESLPDRTFAKKTVALERIKNSREIEDYVEMGFYLLLVLLAPLVMIITLFKMVKGRL